MKVCIKRGTSQIGGTCVELDYEGQKVLLDLGLPLNTEGASDAGFMPQIDNNGLLGVFISHPHMDHYGLLPFLDKNIPVYMGAAARGIIDAGNSYLPVKTHISRPLTFEDRAVLKIGAFSITPYLMDHSAYDSYAFLIEAGGKRLFYSGDFRAHGRKRSLFERFIKTPPPNIDVLLLEGTTVSRQEKESKSEESLETEFENVFKKTAGLCAVMASAQNIDRIVTLYKAAIKSGRELVLPPHAGLISMKTGNKNIPNFKFPKVKKYTKIAKRAHEVSETEILQNPSKYVVLLKYSITNDFLKNGLFCKNSVFIYSMWGGYKNEEKIKLLLDKIHATGAQTYNIHTSGHADIPTLKRLAVALNPAVIIPLHTQSPQRFKEIFNIYVKILEDGDMFLI